MPEIRSKLEAMDVDVLALDGPRFDALIDSEHKRWGKLIRRRKI